VAAAPVSAAATPAPAPVSAAAPVSAPATPAPAPVSAAAVVPPPSPAPESAIAKTPTAGDTSLTLADETTPGAADPFAEDPGAVVANAGVSESTGMGAAAMSIFLLLGGGFFLWRKIRGHRGESGTGRLIRPLGTHVLGPKQGLLLLDVAGEMVLIGTSDKGVQMLTKIERGEKAETRPENIARETTPAVTPTELSLLGGAAEAAPKTPKLNVAERAQAAIAKVRALSDARKGANRLETADEDVSADALERAFFERADEHLAEAALGVEDDFEPRAENFFARLRKAAEKPEAAPVSGSTPRVNAPTPTRKAAPSPVAARPERVSTQAPSAGRTDDSAMTNDILRKIRQLQGA
jgi:flagellar biogenesis protein FliO